MMADLVPGEDHCMEWWPEDDGWRQCTLPLDDQGGPLCKWHAVMAAATMAHGRRARKGTRQTHQGSGGHGEPVSERLAADA